MIIADEAGQVIGAGLSGQSRPDVPKVFPDVGERSGWRGTAVRGGGRQVVAYGRLADGRACELGRKDWP